MKLSVQDQLETVNKELWLVFPLFVIAGLLNFLVASQRMVLASYTLPTIISACLYGRRHATLTALASVMLVVLLSRINPTTFSEAGGMLASQSLDITVWGGTLIVTACLMGTLYEHKDRQVRGLRETYHGILLVLRHFISKDQIHRGTIRIASPCTPPKLQATSGSTPSESKTFGRPPGCTTSASSTSAARFSTRRRN